MDSVHPERQPRHEVPSRYRVHRLPEAKPTERGIVYRRGEESFLLVWPRVHRAFGAEIGEAGEASQAVFDLVVESEGPECVGCRMTVPAGEAAVRTARAILVARGREACSPELRELADAGRSGRLYTDEETFGEAVLEAVRFG